jgi:hypothetical protein
LLAGLRAARDTYGVPGSAIEQHAEQTIERRVSQRMGNDGFPDRVGHLDIEAAIDLALDTLDNISA